jgi:hypothetical protein
MLWSLQYATYMVRIHGREGDTRAWQEVKHLAAWANLWYGWSGSAFVRAYLATANAGAFLPHIREDFLVLLENFLLATVVANLSEALDTQPRQAWVAIAVLLQLLEAPSALCRRSRRGREHDNISASHIVYMAHLGKSERRSIMCHRGCAERKRRRRFLVLWRLPWQTFSALA